MGAVMQSPHLSLSPTAAFLERSSLLHLSQLQSIHPCGLSQFSIGAFILAAPRQDAALPSPCCRWGRGAGGDPLWPPHLFPQQHTPILALIWDLPSRSHFHPAPSVNPIGGSAQSDRCIAMRSLKHKTRLPFLKVHKDGLVSGLSCEFPAGLS